jgi:hypothetical protein
MKKNKLQKNSSKIELKIKEQTGWNRARVFIIVGLIISVIRAGSVNLKKIARKINPKENIKVNYRRLNRFFQKFEFDKRVMAKLLSSFLPDEKWVIIVDRTKYLHKINHILFIVSILFKNFFNIVP